MPIELILSNPRKRGAGTDRESGHRAAERAQLLSQRQKNKQNVAADQILAVHRAVTATRRKAPITPRSRHNA